MDVINAEQARYVYFNIAFIYLISFLYSYLKFPPPVELLKRLGHALSWHWRESRLIFERMVGIFFHMMYFSILFLKKFFPFRWSCSYVRSSND